MDFLIEGIRPLPGRHVTDHQMRLYMTFRQTDGPAIAAAKAAISPATGGVVHKRVTPQGNRIWTEADELRLQKGVQVASTRPQAPKSHL